MIPLRYFSLFLLGAVLAGCTVGYPPIYYDQDLLVEFPLLPHTSEVPVYFPQDTLPNKEYVRVGVLETRGGEFTSYNELIRRLQFQAQERGVDAIQLLDKQIEATEYYEVSTLSGIGIKYLDNLGYLRDFIRSQEIYPLNNYSSSSGSSQWATKIWFDFTGGVQRIEGNREYADFVRKYSLDFLLYEQNRRWRYAPDEYGQVRLRARTHATGMPDLRVWFTYEVRNRPNLVRIREYPSREESTIRFAYDTEGKILKKRITLPDGEVIEQILVYDTSGKLLKSEYYKATPNQQLVPYLIVQHQFYSPEDARERIVLK